MSYGPEVKVKLTQSVDDDSGKFCATVYHSWVLRKTCSMISNIYFYLQCFDLVVGIAINYLVA